MEENQPVTEELSLKQKIDHFVEEIKEIDPSTADRLMDISTSLEEGAFWINLDIFNIINPNGFSEVAETALRLKHKKSKIVIQLEWLRNIFVLVPIFLTWFGLSEASRAYNYFISNRINNYDQSFLYLWQEGFPNYPHAIIGWVPSFSSVAITDAVIILFVIIITGFVMFNESKTREEISASITHLRKTLENLLWEISRAAKPLRAKQVEKSETKLIELIENLSQVLLFLQKHNKEFNDLLEKQHQGLVRLSDERQKEFNNLKGIFENIERVVNKLNIFSEQFLHVIDNTTNSTNAINTAISSLSQQINKLDAAIRSWETSLNNEVKKLSDESDKLSEAALDAYKRASNILDEIPNITSSVEKLTKAQSELIEFYRKQQKNNEDSSLQLNAGIELMKNELDQARTLFASLSDAAKGLKSAFEKSNQFSESINDLTGKVTSAFTGLSLVLGGLQENLNGMSNNIKKTLDQTSELPAQIQTVAARLSGLKGLTEELKDLDKRMQEMNMILSEASNTMGATHYSNLEFSKTLRQEIRNLGAMLQTKS